MKKAKPLGFNLFDGTSSEEDEPPKHPSKGNPRFAGRQSTVTSAATSYAKQEEALKIPESSGPRFTATAAPALTSSRRVKAEEQPKPFYSDEGRGYADATSYVSPPDGSEYGAPYTKHQPSQETSTFGLLKYPKKLFEDPQSFGNNSVTSSSVEPLADKKPWKPQYSSFAGSAEKPKHFTSYDNKMDAEHETVKPPSKGYPRFSGGKLILAPPASSYAKEEENSKFVQNGTVPEKPQPVCKLAATSSSGEPRRVDIFGSADLSTSRRAEKPKRFTSNEMAEEPPKSLSPPRFPRGHSIVASPILFSAAKQEEKLQNYPATGTFVAEEPLLPGTITSRNHEQIRPFSAASYVDQQFEDTPSDDLPSIDMSPPGMGTLAQVLYEFPWKDFYFKLKNGGIVYAHKIVLAARSRYFSREFYEVPDSNINFVNVDNFDKQIVDLAIKACYAHVFDEATLGEYVAERLYKFAAEYDILCVMALLPKTVSKHFITEANVSSIAVRAVESKDVELRRKCAAFIAELMVQGKDGPPGIETLPSEFDKEIILAIVAQSKK